jgi:molybdopterin-containing oxidoreductase family iron-sulfur binding subunit
MSSLKLPVLPDSATAAPAGAALWRSLAELDGAATSKVASGDPAAHDDPDGCSRRDFLALVGAAAALGSVGCKNPTERILPYTRKPVDLTPGNPLHYATVTQEPGGLATGLVVTAYEGRPTKIEGNPDHPASLGATSAIDQAQLAGLYDPERARSIKQRGLPKPWAFFQQWAVGTTNRLRAQQGAGLHLLLEPSASPLLAELVDRLRTALPKMRVWWWAPLMDDASGAGIELAFERRLQPRYQLERARTILSLDADFLSHGPGHLRAQRDFAAGRVRPEDMSRLYMAESGFSVTGTMADHRLRARAASIERLALALAFRLAPEAERQSAQHPPPPLGLADERFLGTVLKDLQRSGDRALVVPGLRQPPRVHACAHAANIALGSAAVRYGAPLLPEGPAVSTRRSSPLDRAPNRLAHLVGEMKAGRVDALVVLARNPLFTVPGDVDLAGGLERVRELVYHAPYEDESSVRASWFLPATHELEAWGDGRAYDGTVSLSQPLTAPLFGGVSAVEVLASFLGEGDRGGYQLLRESWRRKAGAADFEAFWERALHDGVVTGTAAPAQERPAPLWRNLFSGGADGDPEGLELHFLPDYKVWDGRFANNGWLQELPDPITKLTWDNALLCAPATAARLGFETGDVVEVAAAGRSLRAPLYILPGHAEDALSIALGYGRTGSGEPTARGVGVNAYTLRGYATPWVVGGVSLSRTGLRHAFAITQDHGSMEGRPLALQAPVHELAEKRAELEELRRANPSMYGRYAYQGYQWAMAIDLGRCTGCSACVVACVAENNTPVVGRERVARGREMHWLRIDRYFVGGREAPAIITQPVMCVHCENAPCEYVCPVNATVHSDEGLNEMVYNRCVGTRYCSNNCPYKVRRFNFFDYVGDPQPTERMRYNPDVTVRSRGVMEKCTYCVQRIERARIDARVAGRPIRDGELQTACSQVCPSEAIVFGSLHDPESAVSRLSQDDRAYKLLGELGTRPRTSHLLRLKNPNPELG